MIIPCQIEKIEPLTMEAKDGKPESTLYGVTLSDKTMPSKYRCANNIKVYISEDSHSELLKRASEDKEREGELIDAPVTLFLQGLGLSKGGQLSTKGDIRYGRLTADQIRVLAQPATPPSKLEIEKQKPAQGRQPAGATA